MFVTVDAKRQLQAIDVATGALLATVAIPLSVSGEPPLELTISPDGSTVYVFAPQNYLSSLLMAVDTSTYQITKIVNLAPNFSVGPILISPDGTRLYFEIGLTDDSIEVVDTATLAPTGQILVNEYPGGLTVTPSGLILVTGTNDLFVIDPVAGTVINRFTLPNSASPAAVISSPDSTIAYIRFGTSILAVSISTGATLFTAPINYAPTAFAISPDGKILYSTNYASSNGAASVSAFQIASKTYKTVPQLGPLTNLSLSNGSLYVLNADQSAIVSVDVASDEVTHATIAGVGINSVAVAPSTGNVWASSYAFTVSGDILILNQATERLRFIAGPSGALSFSPGGTFLYVTGPGGLLVYDVATTTLIAREPAPNLETYGQAIPSPDGRFVYVPVSFVSGGPNTPGAETFDPGVVRVFDTGDFHAVANFNVPLDLGAVAVTPDGSTLVVTSDDGFVFLISTMTGKVTGAIRLTPLTGLLDDVALSADGSTAYVVDAVNNVLLVADLATATQTATIPVGLSPTVVALTPDGTEAWVATAAGLQIVDLATAQVSSPVKLPGTPSAIAFGQAR